MNQNDAAVAVAAALDTLEALLLVKCTDLNEAHFWPWFAEETMSIEDKAPADQHDSIRGRLDGMLKNAGLVAGEKAGEPRA